MKQGQILVIVKKSSHPPTVGLLSADSWSNVCWKSADSCPTVGRQSTAYRLTVGQQANKGFGQNYPNLYIQVKNPNNDQINKLTSVFHADCPVIDHEFRHNIVKVAVDPRGDNTRWWQIQIHNSPHSLLANQKNGRFLLVKKWQMDFSNFLLSLVASISHKL